MVVIVVVVHVVVVGVVHPRSLLLKWGINQVINRWDVVDVVVVSVVSVVVVVIVVVIVVVADPRNLLLKLG